MYSIMEKTLVSNYRKKIISQTNNLHPHFPLHKISNTPNSNRKAN